MRKTKIEQEILRLETKIKYLTKRNKKLIENGRNYYKELKEFKKKWTLTF